MPDTFPVLKTIALVTGYGKKQIVNGVALEVASGEIVALIGHNGAGKSTLLKSVFGLIPLWKGEIVFDGKVLAAPTPLRMIQEGVGYVPQGNRVFTELTVQENLEIGGHTLAGRESLKQGIERSLALFPSLKAKLRQIAGNLSGGEKQMLALANALVLSPRFLLLDEPSLGLAAPLISVAFTHIQQINRELGISVLIVEQKVREVLKIAHRIYVLRNGTISFVGVADALNDTKLREVYL